MDESYGSLPSRLGASDSDFDYDDVTPPPSSPPPTARPSSMSPRAGPSSTSPRAGPSRMSPTAGPSGMAPRARSPPGRVDAPPRAAGPPRSAPWAPLPIPPRPRRRWVGKRRPQPYRDPGFWIADIRDTDQDYKTLMDTADLRLLRDWVFQNYHKVMGYNTFRKNLWRLINEYMPGFPPDLGGHPDTLINVIKYLLAELYGQWNLSDLSFDQLGKLEGSDIQAKCEKHKMRVFEIVDNLKFLVKTLLERETEHLDINMKLEAALAGAETKIRFLETQAPQETSFVAELQGKMTENQQLQSSLRDELDHQEQENKQLMSHMLDLQRTLAMVHQEKIIEVAEGLRDAQLNESLKNAIVQKIKSLSASVTSARDDINSAISEWMKTIESALEEKKAKIEELKNLSKSYDDAVIKEALNVSNLAQYHEDLQSQVSFLAEVANETEEELEQLETSLHVESVLQGSEPIRASTPIQSPKAGTRTFSFDSPERFRSDSAGEDLEHPLDMDGSFSLDDTPPKGIAEMDLTQTSPAYFDDEVPSFRLDDTPPRGSPQIEERPTRTYNYGTQTISQPRRTVNPGTQTISQPRRTVNPGTQTISQPRRRVDPGTQTIYQPRRRVDPGTQTIYQPRRTVDPGTQTIYQPRRTVDPGTQTLSGVRNLIDVGESFNMRTHHVGTPPSYRQRTRIDATLSPGSSSRMVDNPLNITHRTEVTPPPSSYETPHRSQITRYGYTQKKQHPIYPGFHNSPPVEGDPDFPAPVKRMILTSPNREEPLLVDILVDPKPLIETESGEHFVCDIAVNLQEPRRRYRSIATYGVPPAATPSIRRRGGIGTPRGIFRKDHLNIRRVLGPDYQSPEDYSYPGPRSPTRALPPPFDLSDRSISWENLPGLDTTYDASSPQPALDGTFGVSPGPLDGTYDASSRRALDRTFDASPRRPLDGTFDASPRRPLDGTFDASPRRPLDGTFDASPRRPLDGTFDASPRRPLDGTFDASPRRPLDGTFDASPRRPLDGTFDASPRRPLDGTFDASPRRPLDRTYDESLSPRFDRTFDRSGSPVIQRSPYRSPSPRLDGTFEKSFSSSPLGPYAMTSSPRYGSPRRLDYEKYNISPVRE